MKRGEKRVKCMVIFELYFIDITTDENEFLGINSKDGKYSYIIIV